MPLIPVIPSVLAPFALAGGSNLVLMAVFVILMAATGFVLGRFLGNDERLIDSVVAARNAVTDEMRAQAKQVLADLSAGEPSEALFPLLKQLHAPPAIQELFHGAPLDTLLGLVPELAVRGKEARPHGDQVLRLLTRIATHADEPTRMRIEGAMIKVMPRYRHAAPFLVEICKRLPDAWNDLQPSLEGAASHDPAIARFLRDSAGPKETFVREATEAYMTSMVHFRRLCEDVERGDESTRADLQRVLTREFEFLRTVGTVSRRFVWLPAQAHRFHPLITDADVDLLLRETPSGLGEVHALLGTLALTWATHDQHERRVRRIIAGLEEAASTYPSAADALLDVFLGLRTEDASQVRAGQEQHRKRAYFALLTASENSFEVIKLLGAHGIPRDLYQRPI